MIAPAEVVAAARGFVGVPWRHGGRDMNGMDCYGLVCAVCDKLGLDHPATLAYPPLPPLGHFTMLLADYCRPVRDPEPGGLLRLTVAGRAQHLAIVGQHPDGGLSIIHALMTLARVVEHRFDVKWRRRIVSCWRIRGVQ